MMRVQCWFDGACEPINPGGHAAFGALIKVDGVIVRSASQYVGHGPKYSNNVAEHAGAVYLLCELRKLDCDNAVICGDSKLVINQLSGRWKAKSGLYLPWFYMAKEAPGQLRFKPTF